MSSSNIISWNINSVKTKYPYLQMLLKDLDPWAVCLQETKLTQDRKFRIKNYETYRRDYQGDGNAQGGVMIAVHDSIQAEEICLQTEYQAVAVKMHLQTPVTLCSIYLHHDDKVNKRDLKKVTEQLSKPFIITGDFNGHNCIWGSDHTDARGRCIEEFIGEENINLLNTGSPTHFHIYTGKSTAIDLSLGSPSISHLLNWRSCEQLYSSDHYPQVIEINMEDSRRRPRIRRWLLYKANWEKYTAELNLDEIKHATDVNKMNEITTEQIMHAAKKFIPESTGKQPKRTIPWWNLECSTTVKHKNKMLSKYKRCPTDENLKEFKKARAQARRTIISSKKNSWKNFISNINSRTPITKMWEQIRKLTNKRTYTSINAVWNENKQLVTDPLQIAELFANYLYKTTSNEETTIEPQLQEDRYLEKFTSDREEHEEYNQEIHIHEVRWAIKSLKRTAAGPDRIHSEMLQHLNPDNMECIRHFFNTVWIKHELPEQWKKSHILPIRKPDKNRLDVSSYRPVQLTNTLCKTMEKIVTRRMVWWIEHQNLLDSHQTGFRKKRSTIDNIIQLQTEILEGFQNNQYTVAVFFDLEKAFDRIKHTTILNTLYDLQLRGRLPKFVCSFLQHRSFQVRIDDIHSRARVQETGTPQGSVISPILFILAVNELRHIIKQPVNYTIFADDLAIYTRGKCLSEIEKQLQRVINKLDNWGHQQGLSFSPTKTKMVIFTRKHNTEEIKLKIRQIPIKAAKETRFLGMIMDSKLTWKSHINMLKQRSTSTANILRTLSGTTWGSDRNTLLRIYKSHVRPTIEYGCIAYNSAMPTITRKLNTVQNQAIRTCLQAHRTSPILSLQAESGLEPLNSRRKQLSILYFLKLKAQPKHPNYYKTFHPTTRIRLSNAESLSTNCRKYMIEIEISVPPIPPYPVSPPPWINTPQSATSTSKLINETYRRVRKGIQTQLQADWDKVRNKLRSIKPKLAEWKTGQRDNRREEIVIARLRIGHTKLTHDPLFENGKLPECEICPQETLSVKHVIIECPRFKEERRKNSLDGCTLIKALGDDEETIQRTIHFLQNTGLYQKL